MSQLIDLGKLRFYWAGTYSSVTQYELNDVVRYGGNVYVYINVVKTNGNEPTDPAYWALMVEGINFLGTWNSATQYYIGDAVAYGSTVYVALDDNLNKQPDLFPLVWSQFVEGIQFEGEYSSVTTYQANDVVTYGPSTYIAKGTTNNNLPTNATYWDPFVEGISPEGVYNGATAYVPGNIVAYGANLYVAIANTTGNIPTNATYWTLFIESFDNRGAWATATLYYVNDLVQFGANSYACEIQNTSGVFATDLAAGKWSLFVSGLRNRGPWTTATLYLPYDIVVYGGNTYSCLIQNNSGVFATDLAAGKWEIFNGGIRWRNEWTSATPYLTNDIVRNVGSSYIATEDFTSGGNFNTEFVAGKWEFFAQGADDVLPIIGVGEEGYSLTVNADGATIDWINATGSPNVFYVSPDGNDSNPGTSLALPFASIQAAVAAVTVGQMSTIFVKTGTYQEAALPIVVPPNTAIVGDNQRTVIVTPAAGLAADGVTPNNQSMMWQMSNASILNCMTFTGMTGWVAGSTPADITTSVIKGVFVGFNPASPVTSKSPYIVECSAISPGGVGGYVDGSAHASGNKSMLFHAFTIINDLGIGYYVRNQGKAEIVSCFTYFCYFGYATSGGGIIRALNGNNSYGVWGVAARGFDTTEVPLLGALYGTQLTVTTDPITTGFTAGLTATGVTSGATAIITNRQANAAKLYIKYTGGSPVFVQGEDITDGTGNTLTIVNNASGVTGQKGVLLVMNGLSAEPLPGASIQLTGDAFSYVIQSVSGTYVNSSSIMIIALAQEKPDASPDGTVVTIRYKYSQIRLTGHDFLSIGTGGIATTNYPNTPLQPPAQGQEVEEIFPGRVYYVSTDQDGNFRVGEYFTVDQGTGTATLNANAFNLSGLTSLQLGSIGAQLGETINEFSSDVTMGGASPTNLAVPTEFAVSGFVQAEIATQQAYVDNRVPQAIPTAVGETGKYLVSNGSIPAWSALSLNEIVGASSTFARTGTAATYSYSIFSNTILTPATWSLSGTVPSGISINSSTGVLTIGSSVSTGSYSYTINAVGAESTGTLTETISTVVNPAYPVFSSTVLPSAVTPSSAFTSTATQATASSGTVVHTLTGGTLPSWASLSSAGVLSGTAPASPTGFAGPYTFTVTATNGIYVAVKAFTWTYYLGLIQGQNLYNSSGTYSWTAPTSVTSVSVVAIGGGGAGQDNWANPAGGGAGLGWKNNITVVPGTAYTVVVGGRGISTSSSGATQLKGGDSYFISLATVSGYGGGNNSGSGSYATGPNVRGNTGGGYVGDGGGPGGQANSSWSGGGGAGGYSGRGGDVNETWNYPTVRGAYGGSSYSSTYGTGSGGGTGVLGETSYPSSGNAFYNPFTGYTNVSSYGSGGTGFSGGGNGMYGENPFSGSGQSSDNIQGGDYGGGGGGPGTSWPSSSGNGGLGAVRIIWGSGRAFPSTNTADVTPSGPA